MRNPFKKTPSGLGPQSMKALSRPITTNRKTTVPVPTSNDFFWETASPPNPSGRWATLEVKRKNLLSMPFTELAKTALDLSPEVAKGYYDFIRFGNPGHIIKDMGSADEMIINSFTKKLGMYYGSFKSQLDSMWSGIFMTGGLFLELVLNDNGTEASDLVVNDPNLARFRREETMQRGWHWRLGQFSYGGGRYDAFRYLDEYPLVKYIGFDRLPDLPFGRPVIGPAVYASLTMLTLIRILQKVLANQGLSRRDYELQADELLRLIDRNPDIAGDDVATAQFINEQIDSVKSVIDSLEEDQDYIHLSTVEVKHAPSQLQHNMSGLEKIIEYGRLNVINGFKGISALSNVLDSTTETHIRQQVEYFVSALQSLQDEVATVLTEYLQIACQVQGVQSNAMFKFLKQRTADKKAIAEIHKMQTETTLSKVDAGVITPEEARSEIENYRDELEINSQGGQ